MYLPEGLSIEGLIRSFRDNKESSRLLAEAIREPPLFLRADYKQDHHPASFPLDSFARTFSTGAIPIPNEQSGARNYAWLNLALAIWYYEGEAKNEAYAHFLASSSAFSKLEGLS